MRRFAVAVVMVTVLLVGVVPAASPAPSPEAALTSGFNAWGTGGEATFEAIGRGGQGFFHAAVHAFRPDTMGFPNAPNYGIGAIRLSPSPAWFSGPFCDTNTFGIWVTVYGLRAELDPYPDQVMKLDGVVLDSIQTPLKRTVDPSGFYEETFGGPTWWFSFGVPVYGHLDPGSHDITWELSEGFSSTNTVGIVACP